MNTFVELRKVRCYAYHGVAAQAVRIDIPATKARE